MFASIPSAVVVGVHGHPVTVEIHVSSGLPAFTIVGLPDASCREARDRVRAALLSSGLPWPNRRVTVNLAPAGMRKIGSGLDLPIAVGLLAALGEIPARHLVGHGFVGELGLDGSIRRVPGVVPIVDTLTSPGGPGVAVVGERSAAEAVLVAGGAVRWASGLAELVAALRGRCDWPDRPPVGGWAGPGAGPGAGGGVPAPDRADRVDLADVRGLRVARLAAEIAAAGGHHLLLIGPPGAGKTMLAERIPGLLPELTRPESMEVLRVHSAVGLDRSDPLRLTRPPWRAPHHTASAIALIGGGTAFLRPGEISCAHRGVLFLDELGEFPATVLDALRQPLEEGVIRIARASASAEFPARFLLVAATNPCPCGWARRGEVPAGGPVDRVPACRCSPAAVARYLRRLSGPLLDRFDLRIEAERQAPEQLLGPPGESSASVASRVAAVRALAGERGALNAELDAAALDRWAALDDDACELLELAVRTGSLTSRGAARVRRVARTLLDLEAAASGAAPPLRLTGAAVGTAIDLREATLGDRTWFDPTLSTGPTRRPAAPAGGRR